MKSFIFSMASNWSWTSVTIIAFRRSSVATLPRPDRTPLARRVDATSAAFV